jgi:hypothetical protein
LRGRIPKQPTERGQYKEAFDGTRAYEVGRTRIDLKGKVLAIATHVNINRVDADRKANVRQYNGGERKETGKPRRRKKRHERRLARAAHESYIRSGTTATVAEHSDRGIKISTRITAGVQRVTTTVAQGDAGAEAPRQ